MHTGIKLAFLLLPAAAQAAMAQDVNSPFHKVQGCFRENPSRPAPDSDCGQFSTLPGISRSDEANLTIISAAEVILTNCGASISLQYEQRGAIARVEGQIENDRCAASGGSYVIAIRTMNDNSELQTQEFSEVWQREDDQPVAVSGDYEIGDNVDLVRVNALRVSCRCADSQ